MRNSNMRVVEIYQFCKLVEAGDKLVCQAMSRLDLSARGYHRVPMAVLFLWIEIEKVTD